MQNNQPGGILSIKNEKTYRKTPVKAEIKEFFIGNIPAKQYVKSGVSVFLIVAKIHYFGRLIYR